MKQEIKQYLEKRFGEDEVVCSKMETTHKGKLEKALELVRRNLVALNEVLTQTKDKDEAESLRTAVEWMKRSKEVLKKLRRGYL